MEVEQDVTLTADRLTAPEVVMNAARVLLHPKAAAGAAVDDSAALQFTNTNGLDTTSYGDTRIYLAAGDTVVTGKMGAATVSETLTLTAGQVLDRDFIIGAGVAGIEGYYIEGLKIADSAHFVEVLAATKDLNGNRASVSSTYGTGATFDLPAGDYVAHVKLGAAEGETPFSVKVGERVDVQVVLNAGVLAVSAPGAASIEVMTAKKDLNGNRTSIDFQYNETVNITVPAGDYVAMATRGDVQAEGAGTVRAGERTELAIP